MTKEVLVTVSGLRLDGTQEEEIELVTPGKYYNKNGKDYILYDEYLQDINTPTKCSIIISHEKVDIIKRGGNNVHMTFEKKKKNSSFYNTPFGNLLMGFYTKDLKVEKEEEKLNVHIKYNLDINYNHVSESDIIIKVESKKNYKELLE